MSDMYIDRNDLVDFLLSAIQGSDYASDEMKNMATKISEKAAQEVNAMPEEKKAELYKVFEDTEPEKTNFDRTKEFLSSDNLKEMGGKAKELGTGALGKVDDIAQGISDMLGVMGNKRYPITKSETMPNDSSVYGPDRYQPGAFMSKRYGEGNRYAPNFGQERTEDEQKEDALKRLSRGDLQDLLGRF
jgi:hypothetical protein